MTRLPMVLDRPVPGQPVEILPGVVRVTAPNPSLMTGPGTNTYLVGHDELVAVDPGPDDAAHLALLGAISRGGPRRLAGVVVTHTHPDHAPGAAALAAASGARVFGYGARDGFEPDGALADGEQLPVGDLGLVALHTPGHASNHLCYALSLPGSGGGDGHPPTRVLFSGDHIMGGSTVVIAPLDGDMKSYLDSLERLAAMTPAWDVIAPGHGALLPDPAAVIKGYIAHRLARETSILAALTARGKAAVEDLVGDVYTDVAVELHPVARFSVWAHLRKLGDDGLAESEDADDVRASWAVRPRS
jgi:glyoxylase-like metal-dependent hydrolase (beta-lactamase superfamily II)